MRYLGLDVGDRRIGIALSDETGILASGLDTLECVGPKKDLRAIAVLARTHGVGEIVVGLPRNMDGSLGPQARKTLEFMEGLRLRVQATVVPWDERLTSVMAQQVLRQGEVRRRQRKAKVDKVSAILILQSYLDYRKLAESETPRVPT